MSHLQCILTACELGATWSVMTFEFLNAFQHAVVKAKENESESGGNFV